MSLKFMAAALMALAVSSAPAYACSMTQGSQVINPPNFTVKDPAWSSINNGTFTIGGGNATISVPKTQWGGVVYGGKFIDTGDVCVSLVIPDANSGAGIVFGDTESDTYMFEVWGSGQADVADFNTEGWLSPVAEVATPLVKTGANASNELRIVWNASSASAYINGQLFSTFPISGFQGSKIGLEVQADGPNATTSVQFSNLSVTAASQ
jgi:hypothetical protein